MSSFVIFFHTFKLRQRARVLVIETAQDTKMNCKKAKRKAKTATKTSREKQSKKRRKGNVERSARSENKNLPTTTTTTDEKKKVNFVCIEISPTRSRRARRYPSFSNAACRASSKFSISMMRVSLASFFAASFYHVVRATSPTEKKALVFFFRSSGTSEWLLKNTKKI